LSFRDLIDRITGRRRSRGHYGARVRSRSEPTIQLPKENRARENRGGIETPAAPSRAVTAPENRGADAAAPAYSRPTPALGAAAIKAPPGAAESSSSPDAPTQYHETASYKNDEVIAVMVAIDGELKGEVFPLFDGENRIGRASTSDVVLPSKWISRAHAMVVHQEGVFAIVPLTEKNRTHVNDREVDGAELSDGDTIRLGRTTFRFRDIEGL
jgi:hypothetical protein